MTRRRQAAQAPHVDGGRSGFPWKVAFSLRPKDETVTQRVSGHSRSKERAACQMRAAERDGLRKCTGFPKTEGKREG